MTHTEQFADKVGHALKDALNNTDAGKAFTQELLRQSLAKNPHLTAEEWHEIKEGFLTVAFCETCLEHKEFMDDLAQAVWDDLLMTH